MALTGTILRILGAAILLIAVQFASVAAKAHGGHSHGPDGHSIHSNGAAIGAVHAVASNEARSANWAAQAQPSRQAKSSRQAQSAARAEAAVQSAGGGAPSGSDACLMGCCGTGMGCCGAALAAVSPNLPLRVGSPRIGLARLISVRDPDPRGPRKPPRSLA